MWNYFLILLGRRGKCHQCTIDIYTIIICKTKTYNTNAYTSTNTKSIRALCPNPHTGVFDDKSFYITETRMSEDYVISSIITEPINMLDYYKPDWTTKIRSRYECSIIYGIYIGKFACVAFNISI